MNVKRNLLVKEDFTLNLTIQLNVKKDMKEYFVNDVGMLMGFNTKDLVWQLVENVLSKQQML